MQLYGPESGIVATLQWQCGSLSGDGKSARPTTGRTQEAKFERLLVPNRSKNDGATQ